MQPIRAYQPFIFILSRISFFFCRFHLIFFPAGSFCSLLLLICCFLSFVNFTLRSYFVPHEMAYASTAQLKFPNWTGGSQLSCDAG